MIIYVPNLDQNFDEVLNDEKPIRVLKLYNHNKFSNEGMFLFKFFRR